MGVIDKIEHLCREKNITPSKMMRDLDIPKQYLYDLKWGRTKSISFDRICKIANYFGVDPIYFSDDGTSIREAKIAVNLTEKPVEAQKKDSPEKEPSEFETLYAKLTEEQKGMVIAMMRMLVAGNKG